MIVPNPYRVDIAETDLRQHRRRPSTPTRCCPCSCCSCSRSASSAARCSAAATTSAGTTTFLRQTPLARSVVRRRPPARHAARDRSRSSCPVVALPDLERDVDPPTGHWPPFLAMLAVTAVLSAALGVLLGIVLRRATTVALAGVTVATYLFFLGGGFTTIAFLPGVAADAQPGGPDALRDRRHAPDALLPRPEGCHDRSGRARRVRRRRASPAAFSPREADAMRPQRSRLRRSSPSWRSSPRSSSTAITGASGAPARSTRVSRVPAVADQSIRAAVFASRTRGQRARSSSAACATGRLSGAFRCVERPDLLALSFEQPFGRRGAKFELTIVISGFHGRGTYPAGVVAQATGLGNVSRWSNRRVRVVAASGRSIDVARSALRTRGRNAGDRLRRDRWPCPVWLTTTERFFLRIPDQVSADEANAHINYIRTLK